MIVNHFSVPLVVSLSDTMTVVGSTPTQVSVRIRGRATSIRRLDTLDMRINLDLTDSTTGERNIQFSPTDLSGVPKGVVVERFEPARLALTLDERMRTALPVFPSIDGEPADGFQFYGATAFPDTLEVEGPASEVSGLNRLLTDTISITGRTKSFMVETGIVPESRYTQVLGEQTLRVQVTIDETSIVRSMSGVPVVLAGQVYEARVTPSVIQVTLAAPAAILEKLHAGNLRAVVDLAELAPRDEPYQLKIRLDYVGIAARELSRITEKAVSTREVRVLLTDRRISE
jgi:YbbR domain-containing protein